MVKVHEMNIVSWLRHLVLSYQVVVTLPVYGFTKLDKFEFWSENLESYYFDLINIIIKLKDEW